MATEVVCSNHNCGKPAYKTVTIYSGGKKYRQQLKAKHGKPNPLEGVGFEGRLAVLYSSDGLNDTAHTQGCCCCGGNEILNSIDINVNVLAYALTH